MSVRKPGNGLVRRVWEKHEKAIVGLRAVAWWDGLTDDERDQALAAAGGKKNTIARAYRVAHPETVAEQVDDDDAGQVVASAAESAGQSDER